MSQRIFAGLWLLFSLGFGWMASRFEVAFSYEPVGPKAWPLLLAVLMAAAALYLIFKPGDAPQWPQGPALGRVALLALALLGYAVGFQWLGFPIATALMATLIGLLFGGSLRASLISGLLMGVGLFFFFDRLLDVVLPIGKPLKWLGF
jgi:putative tricarboxylic transport membrane protein